MINQDFYDKFTKFEKMLINSAWFEQFLKKIYNLGVCLECEHTERENNHYNVYIRFFNNDRNEFYPYKGCLLGFTDSPEDQYFKKLSAFTSFSYRDPGKASILFSLIQLCLREFEKDSGDSYSIIESEYGNIQKESVPIIRNCLDPDDYLDDDFELIGPYLKAIRMKFGETVFTCTICTKFNLKYEQYISDKWTDDYTDIFKFFTIFIDLARGKMKKRKFSTFQIQYSRAITKEFLKACVNRRYSENSSTNVFRVMGKMGASESNIRKFLRINGQIIPKFTGCTEYEIMDQLSVHDVDLLFDLLSLADNRFSKST